MRIRVTTTRRTAQKAMKAAEWLNFVAITAGLWLCISGAVTWRGPLESSAGACPSGGMANRGYDCEDASGAQSESFDLDKKTSDSPESEGQMEPLIYD